MRRPDGSRPQWHDVLDQTAIGDLTLENGFSAGALGKAGLLCGMR